MTQISLGKEGERDLQKIKDRMPDFELSPFVRKQLAKLANGFNEEDQDLKRIKQIRLEKQKLDMEEEECMMRVESRQMDMGGDAEEKVIIDEVKDIKENKNLDNDRIQSTVKVLIRTFNKTEQEALEIAPLWVDAKKKGYKDAFANWLKENNFYSEIHATIKLKPNQIEEIQREYNIKNE